MNAASVWETVGKLTMALHRARTAPAASRHLSQHHPDASTPLRDQTASEIVWQERRPGEAQRSYSLAFAFTPGGLLFPYSLGAAAALTEAGLLTDGSPLVGASAGSLAVAAAASGLPLPDLMHEVHALCADCRENGTPLRVGGALDRALRAVLPADAVARVNSRPAPAGFMYATLSPLRPVGAVATHFSDAEDLLDCLKASCHVPFWLDGRPFTTVRGQRAVDGFFGAPPRMFGAPRVPGAERTVRISAFPARFLRLEADCEGGIISPDFVGRRGAGELLSLSLQPGTPEEVQSLYDDGVLSTQRWLDKYGKNFLEAAATDAAVAAAATATSAAAAARVTLAPAAAAPAAAASVAA